MKKTSELIGAELDFWVARAEGFIIRVRDENCSMVWDKNDNFIGYISPENVPQYAPSRMWGVGGIIIERYIHCVTYVDNGFWQGWIAYAQPNFQESGPTPLIAAMRAYVASVFGESVDSETSGNTGSA